MRCDFGRSRLVQRVVSVPGLPTFFVVGVGLDERRLDVVLDLSKRAEPFGGGGREEEDEGVQVMMECVSERVADRLTPTSWGSMRASHHSRLDPRA